MPSSGCGNGVGRIDWVDDPNWPSARQWQPASWVPMRAEPLVGASRPGAYGAARAIVTSCDPVGNFGCRASQPLPAEVTPPPQAAFPAATAPEPAPLATAEPIAATA